MRYGTRTILGRGWTPVGIRPTGKMHIGYAYHYLYLALSPTTGDVFALLLPHMGSDYYEVFLQEFSRYLTGKELIEEGKPPVRVIADNASSHRATELVVPPGIALENIPPYCPELNPCERFFEEIRRVMKKKVCKSIKEVEDIVVKELQKYWENPKAIVKLCYWEWMKPERINTTS